MEFLAFAIVVLAIPTLGVAYLVKKTHDKDLNEWNKENKKKFSNYGDLKIYLKDLEDKERSEASRLRDYRRDKKQAKERARFRKEIEDKIKEEEKRAPQKESFAKTTFSGGGLTSKITRLKRLYKNGTLTKAEFEKAKNNLLKYHETISTSTVCKFNILYHEYCRNSRTD